MKTRGRQSEGLLCPRAGDRLKSALTMLVTMPVVLPLLVSPSPAQVITDLHSFSDTGSSQFPETAVTQGRDGKLYGTTASLASGSIFKLSTTGASTDLYAFSSNTGSNPAGLTLASDGNFYGTGSFGGNGNFGVFFKITPAGDYTVLPYFAGG